MKGCSHYSSPEKGGRGSGRFLFRGGRTIEKWLSRSCLPIWVFIPYSFCGFFFIYLFIFINTSYPVNCISSFFIAQLRERERTLQSLIGESNSFLHLSPPPPPPCPLGEKLGTIPQGSCQHALT